MRKIILILLVVLINNVAKAQLDSIPVINHQYQYQEVVNLDTSFAKDKIYKSAKVYFVDNFNSANDVIQYQDETEGKIIGKGFFEVTQELTFTTVKWSVYFSLSIEAKDGKYRYTIYDINVKQDWYGTSQHLYQDLGVADIYLNMKKGRLKKETVILYDKMTTRFKNQIIAIKSDILEKGKKSDF